MLFYDNVCLGMCSPCSKDLGLEILGGVSTFPQTCVLHSLALTDEVLPLVNDVASTWTFRTGLSSMWGSLLTALPVVSVTHVSHSLVLISVFHSFLHSMDASRGF